ncbi:hypothetical protein [Alkalihalophilus marmarensis]|uniref:hypothetical protein n=1 Tax=Alkalihalophilus marmarensis TaxID=521377 RepID=UPI002E244F86|nr:hypothetical protein [Alkalihalophilus marmarensis]
MLTKDISYDYFQSNNKINRTLFTNDLIEVINEIEKKQLDEKYVKEITSFLKNAKEYSEGKIVTSYKFPPSEAFNYTLKALDLDQYGAEKVSEAINDIVNDLIDFSSGKANKEEELISFLKRLSESFEKEKNEKSPILSSVF